MSNDTDNTGESLAKKSMVVSSVPFLHIQGATAHNARPITVVIPEAPRISPAEYRRRTKAQKRAAKGVGKGS